MIVNQQKVKRFFKNNFKKNTKNSKTPEIRHPVALIFLKYFLFCSYKHA